MNDNSTFRDMATSVFGRNVNGNQVFIVMFSGILIVLILGAIFVTYEELSDNVPNFKKRSFFDKLVSATSLAINRAIIGPIFTIIIVTAVLLAFVLLLMGLLYLASYLPV